MGAAPSHAATCDASNLVCAVGEPQEVCEYGAPCDWSAASGCSSKVVSCACPPAGYMGEATSNVPHFFKTEEDRSIVAGGGIMLWALSGIMIVYLGLRTLESSVGIRRRGEWQASAFPRSCRWFGENCRSYGGF